MAIMSADTIEIPGIQTGGKPMPVGDSGSALRIDVGTPLDHAERMLILATLRMVDGDKKEAARRLGISLKTLYNRLNVYQAAGQLESPEPAPPN